MKFIQPTAEELSHLRPDPVLWEQELDVRPDVAEDIERATGIRAGTVYWRSAHDHLYGLQLADLGLGRPSMATVLGHWDRYEPRPPEHEITSDLADFSLWLAEIARNLDPEDVIQTFQFGWVRAYHCQWPAGAVLRTPEERFADLPDFPYQPKYVEVEGMRMAYVEEGAGDPILLLHGEPTWGYMYRHMIPALARLGRVIVPDLIGFGRSDKPTQTNAYSYRSQVRWLRRFIQATNLFRITLVCHDWGGMLALRLMAELPLPFLRVVAMNTDLPDGNGASEVFAKWRRESQMAEFLDVPAIVQGTMRKRTLTDRERAAYAAPFPAKEYQTAARVAPRLVPRRPNEIAAYTNRLAYETIRGAKTPNFPALLIWSNDPMTASGQSHLSSMFRTVAPPVFIADSGHCLPEDAGEELAAHIERWLGGLAVYGVVRP